MPKSIPKSTQSQKPPGVSQTWVMGGGEPHAADALDPGGDAGLNCWICAGWVFDATARCGGVQIVYHVFLNKNINFHAQISPNC